MPDWFVNLDMIRSLLGPLEAGWGDEQLSSVALTEPVWRELQVMCPRIAEIGPDDEELKDTVSLAAAHLIVANLLETGMQTTSSRLGDSSFTMPAGHEGARAKRFVSQAWKLLDGFCERVVVRRATVWRVASGRRGE